jgi:hypothetical protein
MTLEYFLSNEMKATIGKNKGLEIILNDQFYLASLGTTHFTNIIIPAFPNINIQVCTKPIKSYMSQGTLLK